LCVTRVGPSTQDSDKDKERERDAKQHKGAAKVQG
jgi:hypothetical protein